MRPDARDPSTGKITFDPPPPRVRQARLDLAGALPSRRASPAKGGLYAGGARRRRVALGNLNRASPGEGASYEEHEDKTEGRRRKRDVESLAGCNLSFDCAEREEEQSGEDHEAQIQPLIEAKLHEQPR